MAKKTTHSNAGASLRKRAEERVEPIQPKPPAALSPEQAHQLLHNLQVHQIELEMQNEELRRVQSELEISRERYFDLYDLAPAGYLTLSERGVISEANLTAAKLLGVERRALLQQSLTRFILSEDQDTYYKHRKALFASGTTPVYELRLTHKDGALFWVRFEATLVQRADGTPECRLLLSDITEHKQLEVALQRAHRTLRVLQECDEALMRAKNEADLLNEICRIIVEGGQALMAWVGFAENDGAKTVRPVTQVGGDKEYLKIVNVSWANVPMGRGPVGTAIRNRKVDQCLDLANAPRFAPWREVAMQRGYASVLALPMIWDHQCFGALTLYSSKPEGFTAEEVKLLERLAIDLTFGVIALRTRAEREQMQKQLLRISERSKQLISQELHDGLCQNLAGTSLMSSVLHSRLAARKDQEANAAKEISDLLCTAVNETRNLSHGLHPVGPEGEALMNALSQLANTVNNLFYIHCTFQCPEPVIIKNETVSTHLFRITQEALNNARKHGEADRVTISLRNTPGRLTLAIRDNGIGIPEKLPKTTGLGLGLMKLRAAEIGATLSVRRAGKKGTVVTCTLPC